MQTNPRIEMDMTRYETTASGGDSDEYEGVDEDWVSVVHIPCIFLFFFN